MVVVHHPHIRLSRCEPRPGSQVGQADEGRRSPGVDRPVELALADSCCHRGFLGLGNVALEAC